MYPPITEKEKIYWVNFISFIKKNIKKIVKISLYGIGIFTIYFFLKTPVYSSKISFYTNYNDVSNNSVLSPFINNFVNDSNDLRFSISNYLSSDKFLTNVVNEIYIINGEEKNLVEHWGVDYGKVLSINPIASIKKIDKRLMWVNNLTTEEKKIFFAKESLKISLEHSEDRASNLHTIKVLIKGDGNLSKQIIDQVYNSIIIYSNEINNNKAIEKKEFIQGRLLQVKKDLEFAEEQLLLFMNQNKNLDSPNLVMMQERLNRDVTLHTQLYLSLSDQLELAKIDAKDNTSSVYPLDNATFSNYKEGLSIIQGSVLIFFLSFFLFCFFEMYIHRKHLFL